MVIILTTYITKTFSNNYGDNNVPNNNNLNVDSLNQDITYQEVYEAVYRAKLRKAAGFDGIPSEVLRYDICIELLHKIISY